MLNERIDAQAAVGSIRFGQSSYRGQILVRADSGYDDIGLLDGVTFCISNFASTNSWIIPSLEFEAVGAEVIPVDAGSHNAVVVGVYNSDCVAGGSFVDARSNVEGEYPYLMDVVEVIYVTAAAPNNNFIFGPEFPVEYRDGIDTALVNIAEVTVGGFEVLSTFLPGLEALVAQDHSAYLELENLIQATGMTAEDVWNKYFR